MTIPLNLRGIRFNKGLPYPTPTKKVLKKIKRKTLREIICKRTANWRKANCAEICSEKAVCDKLCYQIKKVLEERLSKLRTFCPETREGMGYYTYHIEVKKVIKKICK